MSTVAPCTGAQDAFVFTTVMASVRGVPCLLSRMSLRTKSASEGYGPIVSFGDTTQEAVDPAAGGVVVVPVVVVVVVVVVVEVSTLVGLVGLLPLQAAPS